MLPKSSTPSARSVKIEQTKQGDHKSLIILLRVESRVKKKQTCCETATQQRKHCGGLNRRDVCVSFETRWQARKCTISLCVHMIDPVRTLNFKWDRVKCLAISADRRDDQHLKCSLNDMLLGTHGEIKMNTSTCLYIWNKIFLKGIVHPKTKNLSSFTHPHVVTNPYDILSPVTQKS